MAIWTGKDLADEVMRLMARGPLVTFDGTHYVFRDERNGGFNYEIPESRAATPDAALEWIAHMARKSWVTGEHIETFAELLRDRLGGVK